MSRTGADSVAIIGMACRFAGAPTVAALWDMLVDGREGVRDYVPGRTAELDAFYGGAGSEFGAVSRRGGFIEDLDRFDAEFFNVSPREAVFMDPQQRLLLEVSWEAIEAAGQKLERISGARTGVFVGIWNNDYGQQIDAQLPVADIRSAVCNGLFGASSRIAFAFGFRGPEISVNAGCASSLSAIHHAVIALRSGACDLAVVAGVNAIVRPEIMQAFGRAGALSPDGKCKFGDASADGFVRSDGAGVLILKRQEDAVAANDRVHAVILGSAVNNNGNSGGFYMRPSEIGQAEAIRSALADAGVSAADLQYLEAHGTGTAVGDPIELNAVSAVVGRHSDRTAPCLIGSVKSNLGHTEAAAGIAGVLKTVLALENEHIPATLHVRERNPNIDWDQAGVALVTQATPWPGTGPKRAGVSSFGLTGTNAHVVLAEAPAAVAPPASRPRLAWALPFSTHSPEALRTLASRYADALTARSDLPDLCFTAATRRSALPCRAVAVGSDRADLAAKLRLWGERGDAPYVQSGRARSEIATGAVLVFPGQGSQWPGMGRELIEAEPVFRDAIARCDAAVHAEVGWSVRDTLLSQFGLEGFGIERIQPTLFSMQVALAALWSSWGVKPALVVGHSMGEIAAAHVAGALSLEDAVAIICRRSAMMTRFTGQGAMTLVELPMEEAAAALRGYEDRVSIAVNNGPRSTVLAGEPHALQAVIDGLESRGVFTRPVAVQVAAHSPQMDLIRDELHAALADLQPRGGVVPIYSTLLGRLTDGAEFDARYWARNLREPVLFHPALQAIMAAGSHVFIEASPHPILLPSIEETARDAGRDVLTLASLRREEPEQATMLAGFGKLFAEGHPVDWSHIYPAGRVTDLPPHPFRKQRYWPENEVLRQAALAGGHPLMTAPVKTADQSWIWTSRLSAELLPWLRDHAVRGAILLPASAYAEIAAQAAREIAGHADVRVENLRLKEAITVSPLREQTVQVVATAERPGRWSIKFHARGETADSWFVAATADLAIDAGPALAPLGEDELAAFGRGAPPGAIGGAQHAETLARRGYTFGPNFLNLQWLAAEHGGVRAEARLDDGLRISGYGLHPALLDAAFQALAAGLIEQSAGVEALIPQSVGTARLFPGSVPARDGFIRADIGPGDALCGDVRMFAADGAPIAEIRNLRFRAFGTPGRAGAPDGLYGLDWVAVEGPSPAAGPPGSWLVLTSAEGEGAAFAEAMRSRGAEVEIAVPHGPEADRFGLFDGSFGRRVRVAGAGVISFASLSLPADASIEAIAANGAEIAALATQLSAAGATLCLVTRGACAVEPGEAVAVAQASVWGLGGVIANESPDLGCRLLDLALEGGCEADAVASELLARSGEPRVALRRGRRFAARVRVRAEDALSGPPRPLREGERGEITIGTPGVLDSFVIKRMSRVAPGPGEVEIEVHAAGLNFLDVLKAMALYDAVAQGGPKLGAECAGRVVRVGANVTNVAVGDRVVAFSPATQILASHVVVSAVLTARITDDLGYEQAAALPCVYLTSYFAFVEAARMRAGETVLVHSATGGVGLSAIHVARWLGARVIASAGTEEKRRFLREMGIADVLDSRAAAFAGTVAELTGGRGVDVILNSLTGEAIPEGLAALAPYGRFIEIGKRDMWDNSRIGMGCLLQNRAMFGVDLAALTAEQPERAGALLRDVMERVGDGTFPLLPVTSFPASRVSEAFQLMAAAKHIGKLVVATHGMEAAREASDAAVRPDATYLISGGMGAIGLLAAQGLAAHGARHLVLCGRSKPSGAALEAIGALRATGVRVVTHALDIGEEAAVRTLFGELAATMPPLRGVVHSAGVLDDALVGELSADRFRTVMRGKVEGARLLDRCTERLDLDFFILFSSVAALLGSMGQGNYAAANAMLDAIAADRLARGLPALSIAWGPWADIGLAAETANRGERIAGRGLASLPPAEGLRMFERLLGAGTPYVAAMHFDRQRWAEAAAPSAAALFDDLPQAGGEQPSAIAADPAAFAGGPEAMSRLVVAQLGAVLRLPPDRVPADKPFRSFGLDSLMGLELRNRLERALGLKLSASTIWNFPTANQLCAHLVARMAEERPPSDAATPAAEPRTAAFRELEDELLEAEAMLAEL